MLDLIVDQIAQWQRKTFTKANRHSRMTHLSRELQELKEKLDQDVIDWEEVADVMFLIIGLADGENVRLDTVLAKKLSINLARTWGEPDEHGVVEHIRDCQGNEIKPGHLVVEMDDKGNKTGRTGRLKNIFTGEVEWDGEKKGKTLMEVFDQEEREMLGEILKDEAVIPVWKLRMNLDGELPG